MSKNFSACVSSSNSSHALTSHITNLDQKDFGYLTEVLDAVLKIHGTDMGLLFLPDPAGKKLCIKASRGFSDDFLKDNQCVPAEGGIYGAGFATGRRIIIEDTQNDALLAPYRASAHAGGFRAIHITPLITRHGEIIGVLSVHLRHPHRPSDHEIQLADLYARQAADALEAAFLRRTLENELEKRTGYMARQKEVDESLSNKEAELRMITNMTSTMLCHCGHDQTFKFVNEAYAHNVQLPPKEIIGKPIRDIVGPEAYARLLPYIKRVLQGQRVEFEFEAKYQNSENIKHLHVIYSPVTDPHGHATGWIASLNNVTDKRKADNVMRHLANIVESSDDAIISKNLQSIITSWNKGAEMIFGYQAHEMIGRSILQLIPENLHNEEPHILAKLQRGERISHFQTVRRCKDGRLIHVSLTVSSIFDAQGKVVGASKIARDITVQKQTEESLARINQELKDLTSNLEKRVEERTARLQELSEQLRQLAVQLTKAEETERKRLAQILHDHLQQLLVAAKMRIDLLLRRTVNPDVKAFGELRRFIDEAFHASRSLTAELRPPVLYEGGLLAAFRFLSRKFHDQYGFEVQVTADSQAEPLSNFLKAMLYSTSQEIIFNAVKYSGVKSCALDIRRLTGTDKIRLVIQDRGVGFDPAMIGRKGSGGFGLFSIRERIKALGGEFNIRSSIGGGTSFEIVVPDERETAAGDGHACDDRPAGVGEKSEGLCVLIADDHKILRQSLASLLMNQPFISRVQEAENGQEAVEKAAGRPDVILMDLNMPHLNGIEAARIIHARYPGIKIIGLSIQTERETIQALKEVGAVAYIHKEENTQVLIETLKDFSKPLKRALPSASVS